LPKETLQEVLTRLRAEVPQDKVRVDTPTRNLESYFLSVVEQARSAEQETSGATSGSKVAAYLRGEAEGTAHTDRVLERLAAPTTTAEPQISTPPPEESIDHGRLDQLITTPSQPAPSSEVTAAETQAKPEDLAKADEKLSSLLGKPK
jgi:hypothetical protein